MSAMKQMSGVLMVLACAVIAIAEEPMAPQPTAEHKALAAWVGSWAGQGEIKAGAFGPGGAMTWTEECSWFEGSEFHVVCRSEGTSPMGPEKSLGITGYSVEKKVYTHFMVEDTGWAAYAEGTKTGDTWTFLSEETIGGKTYQTRYAMTLMTPEKMTFSWEMSEDGTSWVLVMDGTTEKK